MRLIGRCRALPFTFQPADIVSQILNFGLPAPIDVQVVGTNKEADRAYANKLFERIRTCAGHRRCAYPAGVRLPGSAKWMSTAAVRKNWD